MMRRITITLDDVLETALDEAPRRLGVDADAADAEKLRGYARLGYEQTLEDELDRARLATYRAWSIDADQGVVARAASRRTAGRGVHGSP